MNKIKILLLSTIVGLSSCNDDLEQFPDYVQTAATGAALGDTLKSNPNDSLYYRLLVHSGLLNTINNRTTSYTMFVPDNNGMKIFINAASGGLVPMNAPDAVFSGFITNNIPVSTAASLVSYNTCPQPIYSSNIPNTFANFQYPTILNPAPTLSALLRLTTYPSTRNGAWVNNIPMTALNLQAANGVIHHTYTLVPPPQRYIWDRINTDADLTILKAAIQRADSGALAASKLENALKNIGANFCVLAPNNQAFKNAISFLSGGLIPPTAPDAVFIGFLGSNNVSTRQVKGITVYHLFDDRSTTLSSTLATKRAGRFFMANMPTTATVYPTLLSSADSIGITYPQVTMQATFTGPVVSSATVKGAVNPTPSNILINSAPDPSGTSDQHYLNGTLHVIDQVLIPAL